MDRTLATSSPPLPCSTAFSSKLKVVGVSISSFDHEIGAKRPIRGHRWSRKGTCLVPGKMLAEICRSLPNADVEFVANDSTIFMTCRSAKFQLAGMPVGGLSGASRTTADPPVPLMARNSLRLSPRFESRFPKTKLCRCLPVFAWKSPVQP